LYCSSVAITATVLYTWTVRATPASGFVGTTLALGRFGAIDVLNHLILPSTPPEEQEEHERHKTLQRTKGLSDLYVQNNVWPPVDPTTGEVATTGWHSHPGHSLIIVTAGAVTAYEGDDPACTPHVYTQGMGFVDPGGDHVHIVRNEGNVEARAIAVQLILADAMRRIDADSPGELPVLTKTDCIDAISTHLESTT
jgi:hypothetical protein